MRFIDDSLATNPLPTLAALEAVGDVRLALIVGGHDRGVDYAELAAAIARRDAPTLVVTLPDNGPAIGAMVAKLAPVAIEDARDVDDAVARRLDVDRRGGRCAFVPRRTELLAVPQLAGALRRLRGRGRRPWPLDPYGV